MGILIIDLSQIMMANLGMMLSGKMAQEVVIHTEVGKAVSEDLLRHMILNSIRSYRVRFPKYDDVVIAADGYSWRREVFKHYKASRKTTRDASTIDWKTIFNSFANIRDEIKTYFPYRVIFNERAEADDIVAQIVFHERERPILLVSGDKDFSQLQIFSNFKQFNPISKKFLVEKDPKGFLVEHIIRGDVGDGVPNLLSDDDAFVNINKRQKTLTTKTLNNLKQDLMIGGLDKGLDNNYNRNRTMIDLRCCPKDLADEIMKEFDAQAGKTRARIFTYMVKNKLSNLMESISEF